MNMKKVLAMLLAVVLIVTATVAGTVAWLTAQDEPVTNTFTTSNIGVDLEESTTTYKMIPGHTITKDPEAWIETGSEEALLFVNVVESDNFDDFMTYAIADGWTLLNSVTTGSAIDTAGEKNYVIYRKVNSSGIGTKYDILASDEVVVKTSVTKEMMNGLTDATKPTLAFIAYAHQLYSTNGIEFDPAVAWANLNSSTP